MGILANEQHAARSAPTDSVALFLREMAATPLLSRDEELAFARRIEAARVAGVMQFARHPAALDELASIRREIVDGKAPPSSYVFGFSLDEPDAALSDGIAQGGVEGEDSPERQSALMAQLAYIEQAADTLREAIGRAGYGSLAYRRARRELQARMGVVRFTGRAIERMAQAFSRHGAATSEPVHVDAMSVEAILPRLARRIGNQLAAIDRGAQQARVSLLKGNLRLVVSIARRYNERGLALADLVQEGNIGLMKAIERYDPARGFKFSTYATWWIRQSVLYALGDQARIIRVPVHTADTLSKLSRVTLDHVNRVGGVPTHAALAKKMGMPLDKVRELTNIVRDPVSMETLAAPGSDATIGEFIADDAMPTPEELVTAHRMRRAVTAAIEQLPAREADVLRLRFGIGVADEHSLREVGRQLNLSAERVRQIEVRAFERLRGEPGFARLKAYVSAGGH
ncbi:RNA polymerase subunit sigma-70 [Trinickia dabaoshanensis]|uniref:RNA polymerase sigma factor n=1 Tax=Trinickia dabaoshanensis TaxID=564714 RepID=A0A2N7VD17_9BURK|nr:sigma-70 family RNA polymerase sigma factor [Trinickia dabaoshanensis]PMS15052.1 RNA polymerase subunit sigma-70 [Trinickia dabaoshanensis]